MYSSVTSNQQSSTQQAVADQYHSYPYPAYDLDTERRDRAHYILHRDCNRGECHTVARNASFLPTYMFSIALSPLNHYLYKVSWSDFNI